MCNESTYQVCQRCVMDTTAKDIVFDTNGICNYCTEFLERSGHILDKDPEQRKEELDILVNKVKTQGKGNRYDCIIGVSGGVDSSWVLVQAVKLGLRPLAVHMDNGWNSELAQNNIENLVKGLGVDLYTHVIDWPEYKALMQAFFDTDVIDVELLYDNAMLAVNYEQAAKYNIKYILAGTNQATEGMIIPKEWRWFKYDKKNIVAIARIYGKTKLKTFPAMGTFDFIKHKYVKNIKWTHFLDNTDFNKFEAMKALEEEYGYKPYPYKHYESIFTRFYQGHILITKFNVDKRRVHLSTLVASGQLSREDAVKGLEGIPYASKSDLEDDINYFIKKMGWSKDDLKQYLERPEKSHSLYPSEEKLWDSLHKVFTTFKNIKTWLKLQL